MLFPSIPPWAQAHIRGSANYPSLDGIVQFYPMGRGVLVVTQLSGLPENESGFFAMHIHEGSTCKNDDFSDAGGHVNPGRLDHPSHTGDLPTLISCCAGRAYLAFVTDRFTVDEVIGRTVILHKNPDDFRSQTAGNSGERIGCGTILRK